MKINNKEILNIILNKYAKNKNDTGSTKVQIAILTYRINNLNIHFKKNNKDNHSKIGLIKIINKRKKLLFYLKKKNEKEYNLLINKLKIRK
ncbi:30S ribosomal protein S15 [Candidatus Zinderia endosymbiont of Aphrophora alni]|uniref:30S ribosomal protein S15 n=1 Tax=Candidatus Zinderia endosymbiont of Aphrophora alni TaxID=3077951 RepID=UPI0030CC48BC